MYRRNASCRRSVRSNNYRLARYCFVFKSRRRVTNGCDRTGLRDYGIREVRLDLWGRSIIDDNTRITAETENVE